MDSHSMSLSELAYTSSSRPPQMPTSTSSPD